MEAFRNWVSDNTNCLPGSHHPSQIAATVAKFLKFSNGTRAFEGKKTWRLIFDPARIDRWIQARLRARMGPSTIYNDLLSITRGARYCFVQYSLSPPSGYNDFMREKRKLFLARRRAQTTARLDLEEDRGPLPLAPLQHRLLGNKVCQTRFLATVQAAKDSANLGAPQLKSSDFLFALRYTIMYVLAGIAARPSSIYTLTVREVERARGDWITGHIVIKNPHHKTGLSYGSARLVLSGQGKKTFYLFYKIVRPAALVSFDVDSEYVFFNTRGKRLSASSLAAHIQRLQRFCGLEAQLRATDIRKTVTTALRMDTDREAPAPAAVASALCHSVSTSNRHYQLGRRTDHAVSVHRSIVRLLEQDS